MTTEQAEALLEILTEIKSIVACLFVIVAGWVLVCYLKWWIE